MPKLDVLVPSPIEQTFPFVLRPGSAIVTLPFNGPNRTVYVEGNVNQLDNLVTFKDRLKRASSALLLQVDGFVSFRQNQMDKRFIKVANYYTETDEVVPLLPDVLEDWIALYESGK